MKKQLKKLLSIVLALCLMLSAVPVMAAEESPTAAVPEVSAEPEQSVSVEETTTPETTEEVTVLYEDESLRGEYEKHFLMSDGSYQAVVYGYPVHELVDGVWVEIESTNQNARGNVSPDSARSNILDNYVWEGHGVQDSDGVRLYIGNKSGYECQAYIQFATMPTIPAGATITTATMTVNIVSGTSTANNAKAFQVTGGEWTSSTLQWSNKPVANISLEENISHNNKTKYQFSCLAAVQHWYDGDTTGQNENYGIMLCYQNPEIADYNSFYSADCTDATMRPALTISYTPMNRSVDEGGTLALSVSGATGTVTWTSSNTSVATVNSNGVVTGIKAGIVTITAYVDGNVFETFTVYVTIADGVYYIKNTYFEKYLSTTGGVAEHTWTTLKNKAASGLSQLQQLWKIVYLGNGYYSIRPMYALSMALHATSNTVDILTVGTIDSLTVVPLVSRWGIEAVSGGYTFMHADTGSLKMGSYGSYSEYYITTGNYASGASGYQWVLEKVTSITNQVLLLDISNGISAENSIRYVAPGEIVTSSDIGITASFVDLYSIDQSIRWCAQDASVVSVDSTTGSVTGLTAGATTDILAQYVRNGTIYEKRYTICVTEIAEGTYLIRNEGTGKCVDIQDGVMSDGTPIVQWDTECDNTQKWIFTHLGDGTYSIRSANSGTPCYIGVRGDLTADEQPVVLRTGVVMSGMKWKIISGTSGAYKLMPLTGMNDDRILDVSYDDYAQSNGNVLYQNDYPKKGLWYLFEEKDYTLMYIGVQNGDPQMPPILNSVENALISEAQMIGFASTSMEKKDVLEGHMVTSKLFSCITHGTQTCIKLNNATYGIKDLDNLSNTAFKDLKLAYLGACYTARSEDGERCFAQVLYDKGVDTVIGYKSPANVEATIYWAEKFMLYLAEGRTIAEALTLADESLQTGSGLDSDKMSTILEENRFVAGPTDVTIYGF